MQENSYISNIIQGISKDRLEKYLVESSGDNTKALALYELNTKLSEAFYTPIQGFEILLRNNIHKSLSENYGSDWLKSGKLPLEFFQRDTISKTLDKSKVVLTIPKLIAELNLGFWTSLFSRKYEELWRHNLRHIFKHTPTPLRRKEILKQLNTVRELRNRIAHHEPIFYRELHKEHQAIINLIGLICPHTQKWITKESRFNDVYQFTN